MSTSNARIFTVEKTKELSNRNAPYSYQYETGKFSASPGNGRSFIQINSDLSLEGGDQNNNNLLLNFAAIDIMIFKYNDYTLIGFNGDDDSPSSICCTQDLFEKRQCEQVGIPIVPGAQVHSNSNETMIETTTVYQSVASYTIQIKKLPDNGVLPILINYNIEDAGLYNVMIFSCNSQVNPNATTVYISVKIIVYVTIAVVWSFLCYKYKSTLLPLQYWSSLVILLGLLEAATSYGTLKGTNNNGYISTAGIFFTTLFGTLGRAFGRVLVLIAAMGYGILIPTLPRQTVYKIGLVTIIYIIFRGIQSFLLSYPTLSNGALISITFLNIPVFNRLSLRKQAVKLSMYRNFFTILLISAGFAIIILFSTIYTLSKETYIKYFWLFDAFWDLSYLLVLLAVCFIWKPTENNQRYAYNEVVDVEEEVVLGQLDNIIHRVNARRERESEYLPNVFSIDDGEDNETIDGSSFVNENNNNSSNRNNRRDEEDNQDDIENYKRDISDNMSRI
eukprot:gene4190-5245_t